MAGWKKNYDNTWTMTVGNVSYTTKPGSSTTVRTINSSNGFVHTTVTENGKVVGSSVRTPSGQVINRRYK